MTVGILYALAACLIWGLIFVVPQFMVGYSSVEVALGRYLFYGLASSLFFLKGRKSYPLAVWKKAFLYSFVFSAGYFPCLVMGLRYASPAICALIMGAGPISIAFYGNWKEKECSFRSLVWPSVLIFAGLLAINAPVILESKTSSAYLLGLGACFFALATWTWYVDANARFLRDNCEVSSSNWATLCGVATLMMVIVFVLGALLFSKDFALGDYLTPSPKLASFLIGSAVLGVVCSWMGIFLWNRATTYLPISFAGQLTIFETVFGLLFIYLLQQQWPPFTECLGVALFFAAILYGFKKISSTRKAA